ncbi:MAG: diacylglycerol/lipid kinase family protein [Segniliparus sp.]|uniref:diacylglycerol/lipid kinase family protein n=1 Tax=Segniliparus sp. TaxID=2804064 RepID=UPI003F38DB1C
MRAVLVVNPRATTTTPHTRALLISALERELDLTVKETTHRGHAAELAADARGEADLVIAHGGDGTVNELVSGLLGAPQEFTTAEPGQAGTTPAIAVIPGGSANVFARSLGISPDPSRAVDQVLEALRTDGRRRISVGLCDSRFEDGRHEERWFICNAGLGIDADVIAMMEAGRWSGRPVTPTRYLLATVSAFFRWAFRPGPLTLELPGETPVDGVRLAFVSNCTPWTYLGSRPITTNPGVSHEKGLGVFATTKLGLWHGIPLSIALLSPKKAPDTAGSIRIDDLHKLALTSKEPLRCQIDGEYVGQRVRAEFRSIPSALNVVAPRLLPN